MKGLRALFTQEATLKELESENIQYLPLEKIKPPTNQIRKTFDKEALNELINSVKSKGILEPILVRPKDSYWEIIAGERRYLAAKEANLKTIPSIIKEVSDSEAFEIGLMENIIRDDLEPVEEAKGYKYMLENKIVESQNELSKRLGVSKGRISQKLSILRLPEEIQSKVFNRLNFTGKGITERHARALLLLPTKDHQIKLFNEIIQKGLSTRQIEQRVKTIIEGAKKSKKGRGPTFKRIILEDAPENVDIKLRKNEMHIFIKYKEKENIERVLKLLLRAIKKKKIEV